MLRSVIVAILLGGMAWLTGQSTLSGAEPVKKPLEQKVKGIDGKEIDLSQFQGKVVLIVNVASECGYTPQYEGLQALYAKYGKEGLVVLGVPSNDFGRQEPGTEEQILKFCKTNYSVNFPMTAKLTIKGAEASPLYKSLIAADPNPKTRGKDVGWNFEKFLLDRKGHVVHRFTSGVEPNSDVGVNAVKKAQAE